MKVTIWILVAALMVLHQDVWFWNDSRLLIGFLPVGLAYHIGLSIAAAIVWWLATLYAWPEDLVEQVLEEAPPAPVVESPLVASAPQKNAPQKDVSTQDSSGDSANDSANGGEDT